MSDGAWSRLEKAIEAFLEESGEPGLLLDWALVTHKVVAGDDGEDLVSTTYTGAERQPSYRAIGLLRHGLVAIEAQIARHVPEEDE